MKYDPALIEKKWQEVWLKEKTFAACEGNRPKYYVLDMFPYPSGAGLHVGHLIGYTATDILARYRFAKGDCVLHPMGWDSFGLPAEQYALRTGTHPAITTHTNIKNFKTQLRSIGYAYDWDRELATSEPDYYKWTQWLFTKLYERGLAYEAEMLVNYCPALGTVLSNEEVENGLSLIGGHPVERRPLRQWVLKITEYAERLLEDLEELDWPHGLKKLQENWIGKSVGALVRFEAQGQTIEVFTTRHDTIFGTTFLVLAPEHPLVDTMVTEEHREEVDRYQKETASKSDLERSELSKEKSGVFTGSYAINPANGEKIPVWVGNYVLMGYGTGAVMGVPSHDERDFHFVKKYGIPVAPVIAPKDPEFCKQVMAGEACCGAKDQKGGRIVNSSHGDLQLDGMSVDEAKAAVVAWLEKSGYGRAHVNYKLRDWLFSRQRYWGEPFPILHFEDGMTRALELDELPLLPPEVSEYKPAESGESPLAKVRDWVEVRDPKTGKKALRETNTMPQWAGSCWYYLRFCDPHNEKEAWAADKEKFWMPVDLYVGGAEHAVLHLLYARFWHKVFYDAGMVSTKEPFKKLCNQGLVVSRSYKNTQGHYVEASEAVLKGNKYVHWESGEELASHVEKMSKSKLNGVSPDDVALEFGADSLRLYCMFMGPIEKEKVWNTDSVSGTRRFLNRFYELVTTAKVGENDEAVALGHKLVAGVTHDIEKLLFNTAISKMMEFVNAMVKVECTPKEVLVWAVQMLAPFAPHMGEELWAYLGGEGSVCHASWPEADPKYLEEATVTYVVQVNGKVRGRFELDKGVGKEALLALARKDPGVAKYLEGEVVKEIFVPGKLLNLVVR